VLNRPQLPTAGKSAQDLPPQRIPLDPAGELALYLKLFDHIPLMMILTLQEPNGDYRCLALNRAAKEGSGYECEGRLLKDAMKKREVKYLQAIFERCFATGEPVFEEVVRPNAQRQRAWYFHMNLPIVSETERMILSIVWDISAEKERERAQRERMQAQIEQQASHIDELATPLLRISDTSVVMPLIGVVDERRVQKLMKDLLEGVVANRVRYVIIDVTGVPLLDAQVAGSLIRAAQAVRLLGAEIILSGIAPEVAQTLRSLDISFSALSTAASLQTAIAQTRFHRQRSL
jgi:PAS domain S-box-containing protein